LWKETSNRQYLSADERDKAIGIFSQLLDLIDLPSDPKNYCTALRKRAQHYSLDMKFDNALQDLNTERDIACKCHNYRHVEECDGLISQITTWRDASH